MTSHIPDSSNRMNARSTRSMACFAASRAQRKDRSSAVRILITSTVLLAPAIDASATEIKTYGDRTTFQAETGSTNATGPLPDLGFVIAGTAGTITFSVATGGDNMAIGAAGTGAAPDWCPQLPGNDIALGYENLHVALASPVYSMGFDFYQPDATMPPWGGTPVDSTFEVSLYHGFNLVGQVSFSSIPTDVATFLGVWSSAPFDSAEIVDVTVTPYIDDNEYFGEFYTGAIPSNSLTACTDKSAFLALLGAKSASGPLPDLGMVGSAKLGSANIGIAPGGDNLAIGVFNLGVEDWCPQLPGHDIAMGYENLAIEFDEPVTALGFDFCQPDLTMPPWGGTPVDSTFEIRLFLGLTPIGSIQFASIPTDQATFLGVCSSLAFDRATVIDITATPYVDDNEYFGEIYTAPGPSAWNNLGSGLAGAYGDPLLFGTGPLTTGSSGWLALVSAKPSAPSVLIASLTSAPQSALCGTIVPLPAALLIPQMTDPAGEIPLFWPSWPATLSGTSLHFQYLISDPAAACGVSMSNAVRADSP